MVDTNIHTASNIIFAQSIRGAHNLAQGNAIQSPTQYDPTFSPGGILATFSHTPEAATQEDEAGIGNMP